MDDGRRSWDDFIGIPAPERHCRKCGEDIVNEVEEALGCEWDIRKRAEFMKIVHSIGVKGMERNILDGFPICDIVIVEFYCRPCAQKVGTELYSVRFYDVFPDNKMRRDFRKNHPKAFKKLRKGYFPKILDLNKLMVLEAQVERESTGTQFNH